MQDHPGSDLVTAQNSRAAHQNGCNSAACVRAGIGGGRGVVIAGITAAIDGTCVKLQRGTVSFFLGGGIGIAVRGGIGNIA